LYQCKINSKVNSSNMELTQLCLAKITLGLACLKVTRLSTQDLIMQILESKMSGWLSKNWFKKIINLHHLSSRIQVSINNNHLLFKDNKEILQLTIILIRLNRPQEMQLTEKLDLKRLNYNMMDQAETTHLWWPWKIRNLDSKIES
jgi:hypothetical protein